MQEFSDRELTTGQLAIHLGVSKTHIRRWTKRGLIRASKIGKRSVYALDDVKQALLASGWSGNQKAKRRIEREIGNYACSKCLRVFPREQYPPSAGTAQGWWCRGCRSESKRLARAAQGATPLAEIRKRAGVRRAAEQAARVAERAERATRPRQSRADMIKRSVDRQRERYNADPDYKARIKAKKIRRKRAVAGTQVVPVNHVIVAARDGWRCAICRRKVTRDTWSLDHVVPLSKGGEHTYANVVLAHRNCNSRRGAGRFAVQAPLFVLPTEPLACR